MINTHRTNIALITASTASVGTCALLLCTLLASASVFAQNRFSYADAYPGVNYAGMPLTDRVTRLMADIDAGRVTLEHDANGRGYLDDLLAALDIDPSSQFLVFSKTALKTRFVSANTPRALYFNDDTYVAFVQGGSSLEVAAMDPNIGPVFFDFSQDPETAIGVERETNRCLRCHDSYSMTGGGVPRFLLSSVVAGPDGEIVTHEVSIITDTSTPLNRRWGGMYVTGTHGSQDILGNFIVDDVAKLTNLNLTPNGNKTDLSEYLDTSPYISSGSDIVALLVLEHQVEVQNRLTRLNFDSRTRLHENGSLTPQELAEMTRPLLESLFMVHEVPLTAPVKGTSGFTAYFQTLGPHASDGRSLRELDLETRTFRYPLSYLVYSGAFNALPKPVLASLHDSMRRILAGEMADGGFAHLTAADRAAITAILRDTQPDVF
jgi:hypothetical protein